jgi:hypothetical protein
MATPPPPPPPRWAGLRLRETAPHRVTGFAAVLFYFIFSEKKMRESAPHHVTGFAAVLYFLTQNL